MQWTGSRYWCLTWRTVRRSLGMKENIMIGQRKRDERSTQHERLITNAFLLEIIKPQPWRRPRAKHTHTENWSSSAVKMNNFTTQQCHRRRNNAPVRILFYREGFWNLPRPLVFMQTEHLYAVKPAVSAMLTAPTVGTWAGLNVLRFSRRRSLMHRPGVCAIYI